MKKILISVIAVLLVAAMCFVFAACDNTEKPECNQHVDADKNGKCDTCGATVEVKPCTTHKDNNKDGKCDVCGTAVQTTQEITKEELGEHVEAVDLVLSHASQYVVNNAIAKADNSTGLKKELASFISKNAAAKASIKSIDVKFVDGNYEITFNFKDQKVYKDKSLVGAPINEGIHAGYEVSGSKVDLDGALTDIVNALFESIERTIESGKEFGEGFITEADEDNVAFGLNIKAGFEFHYGDSDELVSYDLRVAGNLARNAADTEVAIEVLDPDGVVVGLYYMDTALYLSINVNDYEQKYYIDQADLNELLVGLLSGMGVHKHFDSNSDNLCDHVLVGEDAEGNTFTFACGAVVESEEAPFYTERFESVTELLGGLMGDSADMVISIVNSLVSTTKTEMDGITRYQLHLDLDDLLAMAIPLIDDLLGDSVNQITAALPAPLNQLDLGSFKGVGGSLLITADIDTEGEFLTGVQISYNVAQKDFRFSSSDTVQKLYGPVNVAITIADFGLGEQDVDLDGKASDYKYFSPLNAEVEADVIVEEIINGTASAHTYHIYAATDINPFAITDGEAILRITEGDAVIWEVFFDIIDGEYGIDCAMDILHEGTLYRTSASASDMGSRMFEYLLRLVGDPNSVATPVVNYVMDLMAQFAPEEEVVAPAGEEEEVVFDAAGLIPIITGVGDLVDSLKEQGVIGYNFDMNDLGNSYLYAYLDYEVYNQVVALLRSALPNLDDFDATAAEVEVELNYGEHKNMIYVDVVYKSVHVNVLGSIAKWESDRIMDVVVTIENDEDVSVYTAKLDASEWKVQDNEVVVDSYAKVTFDVKHNDEPAINYVDATVTAIERGYDITLILTTLDEAGEKIEHVFELGGYFQETEDGDMLYLYGTANGTTIGLAFGAGHGELDREDTLAFGIPAPSCGFKFSYVLENSDLGVDNVVNLTVSNLGITNWGHEVTIERTDISGLVPVTENVEATIMEILSSKLEAYLFLPAAE